MMLPAAIVRLRNVHGLTQAELSSLCEHGQSWCSKVERGLKEPTVRDLQLLSHMYGLDLVRGSWAVRAPAGAKTRAVAHA